MLLLHHVREKRGGPDGSRTRITRETTGYPEPLNDRTVKARDGADAGICTRDCAMALHDVATTPRPRKRRP